MDNFLKIKKFISKAKIVHENKYDYSIINEYKNNKVLIPIICKKHGVFLQTPNKHLVGHGCQLCGIEKDKKRIDNINLKRKNENVLNFRKKAEKVHGFGNFEYLNEYENCLQKMKIKCKKCNFIFEQITYSHLSGNGCPKCKQSKGERKIENWLIENDIIYEPQKIFNDCRGKKRPLPFDFYLPKYIICIEFDGRQHFELVNFNGGLTEEQQNENFKKVNLNDEIKNIYCLDNNIKLIRINFKNINKVEDILYKLLK